MPTPSSTIAETAVLDWLRGAAHPVRATEPDATGTDLEPLTDRLAPAKVVGLGESTRFSRQTYGVRERITRTLVEEHGFRALAIQDSAAVGERINAYVRTGKGDPHTILAGAWRPWRTEEMVATLKWLRGHNERHPDRQVEVIGVAPPSAEPADYDAILDYVRTAAPQHLPQLRAHLDPIRTAHQIDEHVQRHQGIHPGRPFADDARDALTLLSALPGDPDAHRAALAHAGRIVAFHENSVAGQSGFARDERRLAEIVIEHHNRTGARIVFWDGTAHTSGLPIGMGGDEFRGIGSHLRTCFGPRYLSVAIGFHHGDLGVVTAPEPRPDLVDAALGTVDLPAFYIDLRDEAPEDVHRWRRGPARARVISGVYDPAEDDKAHIELNSLAGAFDMLIHIRKATALHWLPEFDGE